MRKVTRTIAMTLVLATALAACGGGDDAEGDRRDDRSEDTRDDRDERDGRDDDTTPEDTEEAPPTVPVSAAPATPAPIPTEAETTTPPDEVLVIEESFDDDTHGWTPSAITDEYGAAEIADGQLVYTGIATTQDASGGFLGPALLWPTGLEPQATQLSAVRVGALVAVTRGGSAGVVCGVDPTDADLRYYAFVVSSAGVVGIQKTGRDGSIETLARAPEGDGLPADPVVPTDGTAVEVEGVCVPRPDGTELTMVVDGVELLRVTDVDDPVVVGLPGVLFGESTVITRAEGFVPHGIAVDDFRVHDLSNGVPAPVPPSTAAPIPSVAPVSLACTDGTGDLTTDKGDPFTPTVDAGTDLTAVSVTADLDGVTFVADLTAAPPGDSATVAGRPLSWNASLSLEDGSRTTFIVQLNGSSLEALADSNLAGSVSEPGQVVIEGTRITATFPRSAAPAAAVTEWFAFSSWTPLEGPAARIDDLCEP
jgi:hypothetical protein